MLIDFITAGLVLVVLVFLSTIDSAYESLNEVSLRVMAAEDESPRAKFFRELLDHRQRFELILILGTQLSIAAIAVLLTLALAPLGTAASLGGTLLIVLFVIAVFRQLVPRLISQNRPDKTLWLLLPVFRLFYRPLSFVVAPISSMLRRAQRSESDEEPTAQEEEDEIQAFIDVGEEQGIIEESEGELIQNIIEFSDTLVRDIMRPRTQIVAIQSTATVDDARDLIMESLYSRIPVYRDEIENIEGIVYVRDLLAYCQDDRLKLPVTRCMRPAYSVPESKPVRQLFDEMKKAKVQMALVIDEYGGLAGLVTLEDIIEEILGEIEDEDEPAVDTDIVKAPDGSYLVDGTAEIRKVELVLGKEVEADDFTTVAGLIINRLGHLPVAGEQLEYKGLHFEVLDADSKRVNRARLRAVDADPGTAPEPT
ncbi:MAG TPA: hemolysin family protein [Blastocatellia bacterium]|nr:hemolysin family protein [Blastocatellia bacterium]